jgi:hypothetical protein
MRVLLLSLVILGTCCGSDVLRIKIDAQPDSSYTRLSGAGDGCLMLTHDDFLPISGPHPLDDKDLSAKILLAWDTVYLYVYAEIRDDLIRVNNDAPSQNDCIELKFDPDPSLGKLSGVVNARLTALDTLDAENPQGVDNLYSEGNLDSLHISHADYARRIVPDGYVVELRLKWEWIRAGLPPRLLRFHGCSD